MKRFDIINDKKDVGVSIIDVFRFEGEKVIEMDRIVDRFGYYKDKGLLNQVIHNESKKTLVEYLDKLKNEGLIKIDI